jgi:integrase
MKKLISVPFKVQLLPVSLRNRGVLWPERVQAFLTVVDGMRKYQEEDPVPQMSVALRMMIGAGLREAEALHMEWDRVDWRRHVLIVAQAVTTGKKVKDRTVREIPMVSWLEIYLLRWWAHLERPARGLVLATRDGGAHLEGSTTKAVRKGAQELSITGLTPHRLRATFATNLFEVGTPLSQIQQMLGHEKPEVTMRYIVQRPKDQAESLELAAVAMGFKVPDRVPMKPKKNK